MKNLLLTLLSTALLLTGCSKKELSKDEALQLLKKDGKYPRVYDHTIHTGDQRYAKLILKTDLEKNGYVTIDREQRLGDLGKPLVHFTDKAKPFLINKGLEKQQEDWTLNNQDVKLADEEISEINSVVTDENTHTATVNYTTTFSNISPFSVLIERDLRKPDKTHVSTFILNEQDHWELQKSKE